MTSRATFLAFASGLCASFALFVLPGCGGSVAGGELNGTGGSGAAGSGGSGATGATGGSGASGGSGGGGQACGPATCHKGQYCCNADCGVCAPVGAMCPAIDCAPVDAGPPVPCGPTTCPSGEYCCNASCGVCAPQGAVCPQVDCAPVDAGPPVPCGSTTCAPGTTCCPMCDGNGICVQPGQGCPGMTCPDCNPQDAYGSGKCKMMLGYKWDGGACVSVGGCSCQGTDCGNLFMDSQSCYQAYASCPQYFN